MAGIIAAQDRPEKAHIFTDIFEAPENMGRNRNQVAGFQRDPGIIAMFPQIERPCPLVYEKHFFRFVAVLGIDTARRLPRAADVESMRLGNMNMLIGIFGYTRTDYCEILLLIRSGSAGVDERVIAGNKVPIAHDLNWRAVHSF